jgi:predicted amidophosphoribosyltransferase
MKCKYCQSNFIEQSSCPQCGAPTEFNKFIFDINKELPYMCLFFLWGFMAIISMILLVSIL